MKAKRKPSAISEAAQEQLDRDVAALHAVQATRPLKPPPLHLMPIVFTAGQLELRRAKRLGLAA